MRYIERDEVYICISTVVTRSFEVLGINQTVSRKNTKREKPQEDYTKQLKGSGDAKKEVDRGVGVVRD